MHLEDYVVGDKAELGSHTFEAEEIIAFARRFDPQAFHLSEEAGRAGPFKGLAASGWHSCSVWIHYLREYGLN